MTEHSETDNIDRLPNRHEQLRFAEEVNECMLAGCTGYIYWYMRAHWAFVGTGEAKYNPGNTKNRLLPRAYVMSHFSKHVTGSTRLITAASVATGTNSAFETSAYIKGDSLIVMAIDTTNTSRDLKVKLPYKVKSGTLLVSTGNEPENLCQEKPITIDEPTDEVLITMSPRSFNTLILMLDQGNLAINDQELTQHASAATYYDLHGRKLDAPQGLCIEKYPDGSSRKIYIKE